MHSNLGSEDTTFTVLADLGATPPPETVFTAVSLLIYHSAMPNTRLFVSRTVQHAF